MAALYDTIGVDYANLRKPDPRIAAHIVRALSDAGSVLNVGAGTGSYEPKDRELTALDPSSEMIAQRPSNAAPCVQGSAEDLPFGDNSFDAALAILTIHHWTDQARGLAEMRRVARDRVVLLTFDPACRQPWLLDYLPALAELDAEQMPPLEFYKDHLDVSEITTVRVPHDCSDGFLYAYWRRPQAYLDPAIRAGSSSFWKLDGLERGLERLRGDLESGAWVAKYADVLQRDEYDAGYRLVVARA